MKIEEHEKAYKEHLEHIKRAIDEGIEANQRNIGFNVSQGAAELFAIYLHKLKVIQGSGDQFDHRVFRSKHLVMQKVPQEFPGKEEILALMAKIEQERNVLCYGTRKPKERIEKVVKDFHRLRNNINRRLKDATGNK